MITFTVAVQPPWSPVYDRERYTIRLTKEQSIALEPGIVGEPGGESPLFTIGTDKRYVEGVFLVTRRLKMPIATEVSAAAVRQWAAAQNERSGTIAWLLSAATRWDSDGLAVTYRRGLTEDAGVLDFEQRYAGQPKVSMQVEEAENALDWFEIGRGDRVSTNTGETLIGTCEAETMLEAAERYLTGIDLRDRGVPAGDSDHLTMLRIRDKFSNRLPAQPEPMRRRVVALRDLAAWAHKHRAMICWA